jgi:hypothetical protein
MVEILAAHLFFFPHLSVKVLTVHAGGYAVQKLVNRNGRTCGWFPVSGLILKRHLSRQRQRERLPK